MRKILFIFSFFVSIATAEAAYLDLAWDLNPEPDVAGYRVYYGTSSRDYINFVDVGLTTVYRLDNLLEDVTFYIALTAYDSAGNESDFSAEVSGVGVIDDSLTAESDYGAEGEPQIDDIGTDGFTEYFADAFDGTANEETMNGQLVDSPKSKIDKSNPGSQKGRKLGWLK